MAMAMARGTFMFWLMACLVIDGSLLLRVVDGAGFSRDDDGPSSVEFYVHNPGLFTSFPTPTVLATKGEKPQQQQQQPEQKQKQRLRSFESRIITFDNVITAANAENSPALGRAHGIRVVDKVGEGPLAFTWLFTASFNASCSRFSGTLSFQGTTLNFPSSEFSDVTVTGGTGSFRFAKGYATFTNFYKADEISILEGQHFQVFLRY